MGSQQGPRGTEQVLLGGTQQELGTHQAPPECISIGIKVVVLALLCQIHQEGGQDETEEANVPGRDQLLWAAGSVSSPGSGPV